MNRTALLSCALALMTTACQNVSPTGPAPGSVPAYVPANAAPPVITVASDVIVGPVWQWQRTTLGSAPAVVATGPERYSLSFDGGGRVNVRADCNRGSGSYEVNDTRIKFGAIALTRMACLPASQDAEFLRGLVQATSYGLDRGELVLTLSDGAAMRFKPAP
jgi:heat shock protein HslJ